LFLARRNAKHRDPFEAATRNPPSGRADYVLVPVQRGFAPAGRRSGERAVSVRRSPLYERVPQALLGGGGPRDGGEVPDHAPLKSAPRIGTSRRWTRWANPTPRKS